MNECSINNMIINVIVPILIVFCNQNALVIDDDENEKQALLFNISNCIVGFDVHRYVNNCFMPLPRSHIYHRFGLILSQ